jgi:cytochrome P450
MLNMDPPRHTRLRRLLQNSFTSRAIGKLEAGIHRRCSNYVLITACCRALSMKCCADGHLL